MEEVGLVIRNWEELDRDILLKIYESFDIFERTSGMSCVCNSWRSACCDPVMWNTLDLSMFTSNFIKLLVDPYVYVDSRAETILTRLLKVTLSLSHGHIRTMIFHLNLYVTEDQLIYTSERSPNLQRLVLPAWNIVKKSGICKAISMWHGLESLTMPSVSNPSPVFESIANNCKNFCKLKIIGPFDVYCAVRLVRNLPKLKVLSLRCSMMAKDALIIILDGLRNLEVLNISHTFLIDGARSSSRKVVKKLDNFIMEKTSRLREFLMCTVEGCVMCQRTKDDEGLIRWYKYETGLWKTDEVSCFDIGLKHFEVDIFDASIRNMKSYLESNQKNIY